MEIETEVPTVWIGRYQPFHVGHLAILRASLEQRPATQLVGILCHPSHEFDVVAEYKHEPERNPFSPWERLRLLELTVAGEGLDWRVKPMYIPYLKTTEWTFVHQYLPPEVIFGVTDKDDADVARGQMHDALGRNWISISVPSDSLLTSTALKRSLQEGSAWQPYLHSATHEYFRAIDGPRRLRESLT